MKPRIALSVVLLALAAGVFSACGASTNPAASSITPTSQSRDIQVTLYDDRMDPSLATLSAGVPYHFVVTNSSTLPQECMIMLHDMGNMPMDDLRHQALMTTNVIMPGVRHAFDYTFSMAMAAQQMQFTCYSNGHATMGMFMQIR